MKLFVLNLPRDFSENDLAQLFKAHGNIKDCTIVMDGKTGTSKGFGFVDMALEHEAALAIEKLHGSKVGKATIRVRPAN